MFFILHSVTRVLVRTSSTPFNVDEAVQPPAPHIQLKRVDDNTQPAFNAATHKLQRTSVDDDVAFTRTFIWQAVALTQQEINANTQAATDAATLVTIRNVYNDLRNGVGTAAERLVRIERAVAWLLRGFVQ